MSTVATARGGSPAATTSHAAPRGSGWWLYILLGIGVILLVGPFIWMLLGSIKTTGEVRAGAADLVPAKPDTGELRAVRAGSTSRASSSTRPSWPWP